MKCAWGIAIVLGSIAIGSTNASAATFCRAAGDKNCFTGKFGLVDIPDDPKHKLLEADFDTLTQMASDGRRTRMPRPLAHRFRRCCSHSSARLGRMAIFGPPSFMTGIATVMYAHRRIRITCSTTQ